MSLPAKEPPEAVTVKGPPAAPLTVTAPPPLTTFGRPLRISSTCEALAPDGMPEEMPAPAWEAVAGLLIVSVPAATDSIVVPGGIPGPTIAWPTPKGAG